jgi:class 3 adenylate cyclase
MNSLQRERHERRLAAIRAADVAGYSRLMGQDEQPAFMVKNDMPRLSAGRAMERCRLRRSVLTHAVAHDGIFGHQPLRCDARQPHWPL